MQADVGSDSLNWEIPKHTVSLNRSNTPKTSTYQHLSSSTTAIRGSLSRLQFTVQMKTVTIILVILGHVEL